MSDLIKNIDNIRTTELGKVRIKLNLNLDDIDVVEYCKNKILNSKKIECRGKNYYVSDVDCIITVNKNSYTIITAHKNKDNNKTAYK